MTAASSGERAPEGPAAAPAAGAAGSFGASLHAQALARRRAMGDEPGLREVCAVSAKSLADIMMGGTMSYENVG